MLKSVLLLTLAVSGNFVGNTLGCKTQYHMTNNMYVKHILLIFIIFFTINYTTSENEFPLNQVLKSLMIWVCYLLFTKQNIQFTTVSACILILAYVIDTLTIYYQKESEKNDKDSEKNKERYKLLNKIKYFLLWVGVLSIIIGFGLYSREKYIEYGNKFNFLTFIFGKTSCNSLQT